MRIVVLALVALAAAASAAATDQVSVSVTLLGTGTGSVTSTPPGIDCGATCTFSFAAGTALTLTATPDGGSRFGGWGGGCQPAGTSCTVTLSTPLSVTAKFLPLQCRVPRILGLTLRRAKAALLRSHCSLGRARHAHSTRVPKGDVLAQSPRPGTLWSAGTPVRVTLSLGRPPPPVRAPVVSGYLYAPSCPYAGIAHRVDRWGMYACNCTSYVAWALQRNGLRIDWFVAGEMDARNWPQVARSAGLPVGRSARVAAVAVWPRLSPPFGHVAFVTAVLPGGRFDVAEYNSPLDIQPFSFDRRSAVSPAGAQFIYVPR